ncbi:hypothetical protein ASD24_24460 [Paenibacillus sp. Root52]|uniref:hypothetical protein n=1 Tax=Paenibacillus sp. Root52 TaxID=1736552 RepID=UPI0006FCC679|nr:hypothetical protein [Paenibacillus sp. Root52]KQY90953.1 hypothetical protein ASD24_24460 [Paenibacillus sp. Root52]
MADKVLPDFRCLDLSDIKIPLVSVYNKDTADYPGLYVARLYDASIPCPTNCVLTSQSYEDLVNRINASFGARIKSSPTDDPNVIESWL